MLDTDTSKDISYLLMFSGIIYRLIKSNKCVRARNESPLKWSRCAAIKTKRRNNRSTVILYSALFKWKQNNGTQSACIIALERVNENSSIFHRIEDFKFIRDYKKNKHRERKHTHTETNPAKVAYLSGLHSESIT